MHRELEILNPPLLKVCKFGRFAAFVVSRFILGLISVGNLFKLTNDKLESLVIPTAGLGEIE